MSSYTVEFNGTRAEREAKALAECKSYLGSSYRKVLKGVRNTLQQSSRRTVGYRTVRFGLAMFSGIEGYWPVRAMIRAALKR